MFQIWRLVVLEPLGVQRRYVSHFKGQIYGKVEPEAQGHDSTFTFRHTILKKAILQVRKLKMSIFLGSKLRSKNLIFNSFDRSLVLQKYGYLQFQ